MEAASVGEFLQAIARESRIPGAGLVVVHEGIVSTTSIGIADDTGQLIDAGSLFPLGDISSVFSAAAIAVSGLSLDDDLSEVLPWIGISTNLRGLLTHTSGFDDRLIAYATDKNKDENLEDWLRSPVPYGTAVLSTSPRRSRWGIALAGHMVARSVSSTYQNAVQQMVFEPLGMLDSTFLLPEKYVRAMPCPSTQCRPLPVLLRRDNPAGGMFTTLSDMGRFLELMLTPKSNASERISEALTTPAWSSKETIQSMSLGMAMQMIGNSKGVALSGGSLGGYRSLLILIPEFQAGLFLITTGGDESVGQRVLGKFETLLGSRTESTLVKRSRINPEYAGVYLEGSAPRAGMGLYPGLFVFSDPVAIDSVGWLLRVEGSQVIQYGKVGPDRFRQRGGSGSFTFNRDSYGKIATMHADSVSFGARFPTSYDRVTSLRNPQLISDYLPLVVIIPIFIFLIWLFLVSGIWSGQSRGASASQEKVYLSTTSRLAFGMAFIVLMSEAIFVFRYLQELQELSYLYSETLASGLSLNMYRLAWLGPLIAIGVLVLCVSYVTTWRGNRLRWIDHGMLVSTCFFGVLFVLVMVWFDLVTIPPSTFLR